MNLFYALGRRVFDATVSTINICKSVKDYTASRIEAVYRRIFVNPAFNIVSGARVLSTRAYQIARSNKLTLEVSFLAVGALYPSRERHPVANVLAGGVMLCYGGYNVIESGICRAAWLRLSSQRESGQRAKPIKASRAIIGFAYITCGIIAIWESLQYQPTNKIEYHRISWRSLSFRKEKNQKSSSTARVPFDQADREYLQAEFLKCPEARRVQKLFEKEHGNMTISFKDGFSSNTAGGMIHIGRSQTRDVKLASMLHQLCQETAVDKTTHKFLYNYGMMDREVYVRSNMHHYWLGLKCQYNAATTCLQSGWSESTIMHRDKFSPNGEWATFNSFLETSKNLPEFKELDENLKSLWDKNLKERFCLQQQDAPECLSTN